MRLIDADALMRMCWVLPNRMTRETALECFRNIVNEAPTIEAEPDRHGEWKEVAGNICCTACGAMFKDEICHMNVDYGYRIPQRCPECGASMAVEAEKHERKWAITHM